MEDALALIKDYNLDKGELVLILVVMEDALALSNDSSLGEGELVS